MFMAFGCEKPRMIRGGVESRDMAVQVSRALLGGREPRGLREPGGHE